MECCGCQLFRSLGRPCTALFVCAKDKKTLWSGKVLSNAKKFLPKKNDSFKFVVTLHMVNTKKFLPVSSRTVEGTGTEP